ncbi:MAG TPA: hypothetical protein VGK67_23225 [Myxococcales bacterium]|jgi:TolB-like protein
MRVLVATLVVALHGAAFGAQPKLALYPLKAVGTSAEAMQQLEAALRIELKRAQDLEIVEGPLADPLKGCQSVACLVAYGRSLQAQEVISGEVRAMPDSYSVTMRLFDVGSGKEIAHTAGSYNRDIEEMVWATRAQVAKLKAPQRYAGQLVVEAPAGSVASVNGSPVKPGDNLVLKAGLHEVRVERGGKATQSWVEVRFEHVSRAKVAGEKIDVTYEAWAPPEKVEYAQIAAPQNPPLIEEPLAPLIAEEPTAMPVRKEEPKPAVAAGGGMPMWPGIVALVAGVAAAGVGAYELVEAGRFERELSAMRVPPNYVPEANVPDAVSKRNAMNTATTIGALLVGAGAVVTIAGGTLIIVSATQGSAQVAVAGSF